MGVAPPNAYGSMSPGGDKKKPSGSGNGIMNFITDAMKNVQGLVGANGLLTAGPSPTSLAESIERQAAGQDAQLAQSHMASGAIDPFAALSQQLYGAANSISAAPTPLDQLRKMAQEQVNAQFDPQINALTSEVGLHTKRASRSEKTARDMYGSLAKDYLSQLPDITNQYKAEDDAANQRYDQAQQQMGDEYKQNASQQDAVLKQLGIQAAAPDANKQTSADQAYFQNQSNMDQQAALDALNQQQMAEMDYSRNLGNSSRMAGENTAQDIHQQLSDYLDQAGAQRDSLDAGKSQAMAALLAQLQQQDQQRVSTANQQAFDNMMKMYNFQLQATQDSVKNAQNGAGGFGSGTGLSSLTSGLPGAQNYLASVYPNQPILASGLMKLLNNVISNPDVTKGKYVLNPGDPSMGQAPKYSDVGQQYMEDLLRNQFEQQGNRYNTQDINATMAALEAYLGKLR
jgi:hypothetical protein